MRIRCELPAHAGAEARERILKSQTGFLPCSRSARGGRAGGEPLTPSEASTYLPQLFFGLAGPSTSMNRAAGNEADIQAAQPQAVEQARVSRPHGHEGRPQNAQPPQKAQAGADRGDDRQEAVGVESGSRPERLPRGARIHSSSEIRRLLAKGKRQRTTSLDVYVAASGAARSRLGVIVPKHGRRIVDRNLLKRRLREIGRRQILPALDERGARRDILIRARVAAYSAEFETLAREVSEALEGLCSDVS